MPAYDIVMILVILGAMALGAMRGMMWQLAPITSLILGYVFAIPLSSELAPYFGSQAPMNQFVAMIVVYLAVSLAVYFAARSIRGIIESLKMESYDRHLGSLLGCVKGLLLCLTITFFAVAISPTAREHVMESKSGYAAAVIMDKLHPVIPEAMHELLEPYIHTLDATATRQGATISAHGHDDHDHDHAVQKPVASPANTDQLNSVIRLTNRRLSGQD